MTDEQARREVVRYWLAQAADALASARSEAAAGRFNFAVNRAYYACFYAASAVLLSEGRKFVKHSGVRAALHLHLVKTARIDLQPGRNATTQNERGEDRLRLSYRRSDHWCPE
jgi:uncharacterized protein (UPF0332 family)